MKHIVKVFCLAFLLLNSCSLDQENQNSSMDTVFFNRINGIVNNPSSYNLLNPEKINPFEFDLKIPELGKGGARIQTQISENLVIPDELIQASIDYQKIVRMLIQESTVISNEKFNKLAYAVELEILNSAFSDVKKDFLLKELATLKAIGAFKNLHILNKRIMCDSQWECDVLGCMEGKMEEQFGSDVNWIDLLHNFYSLPLSFPVAWSSCVWDASFG